MTKGVAREPIDGDAQGVLEFETEHDLDRAELPRNPVRNALGGYDNLGRKQPHRAMAGYSLFVHLLPYVPLSRIREVPQSAVDRSDEVPVVHCPCETNCVVPYDTFFSCPGCERHYITTPQTAWVMYGDMDPPQVG